MPKANCYILLLLLLSFAACCCHLLLLLPAQPLPALCLLILPCARLSQCCSCGSQPALLQRAILLLRSVCGCQTSEASAAVLQQLLQQLRAPSRQQAAPAAGGLHEQPQALQAGDQHTLQLPFASIAAVAACGACCCHSLTCLHCCQQSCNAPFFACHWNTAVQMPAACKPNLLCGTQVANLLCCCNVADMH